MNKYVRIMHPGEAAIVRATGIVPTNRDDWGKHKAGTVVFLFEADRVSWAYVCSRAEDLVEECGRAVILSFQSSFAHSVDESGWDGGGAVVHNGQLAISAVMNPQWRIYSSLPTGGGLPCQH